MADKKIFYSNKRIRKDLMEEPSSYPNHPFNPIYLSLDHYRINITFPFLKITLPV
jgi:hypothetical protein